MSDIRSSEVAFTGFRFIRANPAIVAIWAGVYLSASAAGFAAILLLAGPEFAELQRLQGEGEVPANLDLALFARLGPVLALIVAAFAIGLSVVYAGAARAILRPEDRRGAYLRLGADEWRQFLLFLLVAVVFIGAYVAMVLAASVAVVAGAPLLRGAGAGGIAIGALLAVFGVIAGVCAMFYCAIRLSLASPLTFDRGKVDLFGSWALTRGRFWSLLGAYLLAWILAMIINAAAFVITTTLGAAGGLSGLAQLGALDLSSIAAALSLTGVIALVISAVTSALIWPVMLMPVSEIYRRIAGDNPADAF